MQSPRASGLLLHPTSLPGRFGVGDLGTAAYEFVNFLDESKQQIWQILPLGPTGHGNSPYMSYSSMAGNPLLISLERLRDDGFLAEEDFANLPEFPAERVDYDLVAQVKLPLLWKAVDNFKANATPEQRQEFESFCTSKAFWLDDYAFFMALKDANNGASWHQWDAAIARREPEAMEHWRSQLAESIFGHKFLQFEFVRQWTAVKQYANEKGIRILGDMPIYVAHDSADVWAFPQIFHLDPETFEPALMAGVPPDYFSETGQLWGNPIYKWDEMERWGFKWWIQRFQAMLDFVDMTRVDHFRGFRAYWAVPQGETTAINGEWVQAPGEELFETIKQELGTLPVVAEDLGLITPDVLELRDKFQFPGMKVLHFAFGSGSDNPYLPFQYEHNCLVYTGTHDNDTTVGWFNNLQDWERENVVRYLGCTSQDGIHWDLIRLALGTVAVMAVFPLQDILGLGSEARMNAPGKATDNWQWRYQPDMLKPEWSDRLRSLTELYGRAS
ncbi:4-alpha-glucanotransferase [Oculatella sp. LEGE 06141]|uniref:4-alpha-glucanotransferase n=1 Tax=Oculatella sp. LEGE 06141 TaxID=1828648 RepID=UPI00187E1F64|nr:4-alpha-glucanotransferase [Oculatella sp. LEGE 06141]MBE9178260.1 4-alpha-glucanotransferase [Oculatella sp. LEGE 06141]